MERVMLGGSGLSVSPVAFGTWQLSPRFWGDLSKDEAVAAMKYELTIYQLVVVTTLMHPAIHVAVCGIKTSDQIAEAIGAVGKTISREDFFAVRKLVGPTGPKLADAKGEQK